MNWKFWQKKQEQEVKLVPRTWRISLEHGDSKAIVTNIAKQYDNWNNKASMEAKVNFWDYVYTVCPEIKTAHNIDVDCIRAGFLFTEILKNK